MNKETSGKNIALALILSLLVMILGGVVWGLVYAAQFFSAWISFLFSFLALVVYYKFNRNGKWWMFAYVLIVSLVINYFAMCISATFVALSQAGLPFNLFNNLFPEVISISFGEGISDTLLCAVFTLLGCGLGIISIISENKRNAVLERYASETGADVSKLTKAEKNKIILDWSKRPVSNASTVAKEQTVAPEAKVDAGVLYGEILEEISLILASKNDMSKEEMLDKLNSYKSKRIDTLSAEARQQLASLSSEVLEQAKLERARKVFVKLIK